MLTELGIKAKKAQRIMLTKGTKEKNEALSKIADALEENSAYIIEENKKEHKDSEPHPNKIET